MLRVNVTKPKDGKTTIVADDKRGPTGYRAVAHDVPVADVEGEVSRMLAEHDVIRERVREARRPQSGGR